MVSLASGGGGILNESFHQPLGIDMGTAYADAAGRTLPDFTELGSGDISGLTLTPGLYKWGTAVIINADVHRAGGPRTWSAGKPLTKQTSLTSK